MTKVELKRADKATKKFLDTIDIKGIYNILSDKSPYITIDDLMDYIEKKYNYSSSLPEELKGDVFNVFDQYDFIVYLRSRYTEFSSKEEVILKNYVSF